MTNTYVLRISICILYDIKTAAWVDEISIRINDLFCPFKGQELKVSFKGCAEILTVAFEKKNCRTGLETNKSKNLWEKRSKIITIFWQ